MELWVQFSIASPLSRFLFTGVSCSNLTISHSNATSVHGIYEDTIYIACDEGFQIPGGGQEGTASRCLASAHWDVAFTACESREFYIGILLQVSSTSPY